MADEVFTPESATWSMPAPGRRGMNFTKEDLLAALVQAQNQPKSPYTFGELPTVAGPEPSREEQFQRDWDTAMQQYQARVANPRVLAPGISFDGQTGNLDTPEAAYQATLAPLRFQAAEFSPNISRAFTEQDVAKHRMALERQAQQRFEENLRRQEGIQGRSQASLDLREKEFDFRKQTQKAKDALTLISNPTPAARKTFDDTYGEGESEKLIPKKTSRFWDRLFPSKTVGGSQDLSADFGGRTLPGLSDSFDVMPTAGTKPSGTPTLAGPTSSVPKPTRARAQAYVKQYGSQAEALKKLKAEGFDVSGYAD